MSEDNQSNQRPASVNFSDDINTIHLNEKHLFPSNIENLSPVRERVVDNMSRMVLLKQLENDLELFDCYDQKNESEYEDTMTKLNYATERSTMHFYLPLLASTAVVALKGGNPLALGNWANNIKLVTAAAFGTYFLWSLYYNSSVNNLVSKLGVDQTILRVKADLHTQATNLTHYLKFPENDLH